MGISECSVCGRTCWVDEYKKDGKSYCKKCWKKLYDSKTHVYEFKRTCNECGKVWHSLASRETQIQKNMRDNSCGQCSFCGNPGAQLQAKRNVEAGETELDRLRKCPNCGSANYKQEVKIYGKK